MFSVALFIVWMLLVLRALVLWELIILTTVLVIRRAFQWLFIGTFGDAGRAIYDIEDATLWPLYQPLFCSRIP